MLYVAIELGVKRREKMRYVGPAADLEGLQNLQILTAREY
jgi:hypothetical protein